MNSVTTEKRVRVQCQYCNYEFVTTRGNLLIKLGEGNYTTYCPDCDRVREVIFI